jgi:hypothetical protein
VFFLLEFPFPSRRIFIGSHLLPPLWFAASVLKRARVLGRQDHEHINADFNVVDLHTPPRAS